MTVSSQTSKVTAAGNDAAVDFSFSPLVIFQSSDLVVTHVAADDTETVLSEGTSDTTYSVEITTYPATGAIKYPAVGGTPLATGASLVIKRVLTLEQQVNLGTQGGYFPQTQETALDKLTMQNIQQQETLDRALVIPISDTTTDPESLTDDIITLAAISDDISTVAGISTDVTDVAAIDSDVSAVAPVAADVTAVAAVTDDVTSVAAQVVGWDFDSSTTMADPGTGDFRLNHATLASVTAIAFSATDSAATDVSAFLATWGDSSSTTKATVLIRKGGSSSDYARYDITAAVTDNTTWLQATVTHSDSNGSFSDTDDCYISVSIWGDAGTASPSAEEGVEGIAELATQAEVDAGTDDTRIVTPLKLANASSVSSNPAAISGVVETDGTFVDVTQPFVMPDGSGTFIASVKDAGADGTVEIWDFATSDIVGATAEATVTLTGAATVTSIAQSMGYVIVGSEDGMHIIDKYDGSWAERTVGWPRSLSTSTTPALTNNDINAVGAGVFDSWPEDPRTGGKMPCFGVGYGTGADICSLIKYDGTVLDKSGTVGNVGVAISENRIIASNNTAGDQLIVSVPTIDTMTADDWSVASLHASNDKCMGFGSDAAVSSGKDITASAHTNGLSLTYFMKDAVQTTQADKFSGVAINRTYNTGIVVGNFQGAWLANSATADRTWRANTLTENGTVTEGSADGASGELLAYSGFSDATNWLSRAYDADLDFGTGDFSIMTWLKRSGTTGANYICRRASGGGSPEWQLYIQNTGTIGIVVSDGTNEVNVGGGINIEGGDWHFVVLAWDGTDKTATLYVDTVISHETTNGSVGSLSNGSATLAIGSELSGGGAADETTISLFRVSATAPSAAQIRAIYEAEKGMFDTGAKVLLQSGTTDAVLDVDVDPITGKVAVTQTDDVGIWDGLVYTAKSEDGSNTTYEHMKLWNDSTVIVGDADMNVSRPAEVVREMADEIEELKAAFAGADLGSAAAWCYQDASANIYSSYGIESTSKVSTGRYRFVFTDPFKTDLGYTCTPTVFGNTGDQNAVGATNTPTSCDVFTQSGASSSDQALSVLFHGEKEGK